MNNKNIYNVIEMSITIKSNFDNIDLRIIELLQQDSRLSFKKIADKLGIAVGTAYNRIKNLETEEILKGYTILVEPYKLGFTMTAIILIQADGTHLTEVEEEIAKTANIISVYDITGEFDILVAARFKDRNSLNAFIKNLVSNPNIKRTVTNVVLNTVKEDFRVNVLSD
jgi:DNA-binding Lrp family transcriptional regulator